MRVHRKPQNCDKSKATRLRRLKTDDGVSSAPVGDNAPPANGRRRRIVLDAICMLELDMAGPTDEKTPKAGLPLREVLVPSWCR